MVRVCFFFNFLRSVQEPLQNNLRNAVNYWQVPEANSAVNSRQNNAFPQLNIELTDFARVNK